jgi:hypothetical protein
MGLALILSFHCVWKICIFGPNVLRTARNILSRGFHALSVCGEEGFGFELREIAVFAQRFGYDLEGAETGHFDLEIAGGLGATPEKPLDGGWGDAFALED